MKIQSIQATDSISPFMGAAAYMRQWRYVLGAACLLFLALAAFTPRPALAVMVELEGPISSVASDGFGGADMVVMGITVHIPPGTQINSPTAVLSIADLLNTDPLPGRSQAGFLGGTAIVLGDSALDPVADPSVTAADVFVEPAENVVLGAITDNTLAPGSTVPPLPSDNPPPPPGQVFQVQGANVVRIDDPRVPTGGAINGAGLPIDLSTAAEGALAGVEGYFGNDGNVYVHTVEAEGDVVGGAQVTITRAECREKPNQTELRVQGGSTDPGTIEIRDANDLLRSFGTAEAVLDPETGDALWNFRVRGDLGACPTRVRATHTGNGAFGEADVTIR